MLFLDVDLRPVDFLAEDFLAALFLEIAFLAVDFLPEDFLAADFLVADLRAVFLVAFLAAFFDGTFAPASLASLMPIAMACLRLVTLSPELDFNLPSLYSLITSWILFSAFLEYLAMIRLGLVCKWKSGFWIKP